MDANRADIILGGAAIILTLMDAFGAEKMTVSDRGLRDGICLITSCARGCAPAISGVVGATAQRPCNWPPLVTMRRNTPNISPASPCGFSTNSAACNCTNTASWNAKLLEYAAIAHDIGAFLSHSNHQKHAYYLIRNYDLLGFNDTRLI